MSEPAEKVPRSTIIGLALSLVIPFLLVSILAAIFTENKFAGNILLEIGLWSCTAGVLLVVTRWEKLPLRSIRLVRPTAKGILLGIGLYFALGAVILFVRSVMFVAEIWYDTQKMMALLMKFPAWWRIFMVVSAAVVEEILFRGYAIERLLPIVKSRWLAGLIPLIVFTFGHIFSQRPGNLIVVFVTGAFLTVVYLWKRDLTINITTHFIVDFVSVMMLMPVMAKGL